MKILWTIAIVLALLGVAIMARAQSAVVGNQHTPAGSLEGSHQFTGNKCTAISVTWHSMAPRWLMVFDTQTPPAQGAFTAAVPLIVCQYINGASSTADGTQNFDWSSHPIIVTTGLLVIVSTNSAACTALTTDGANDWFSGQMQ
jgi:hypothetical protein